MSSIDQQFVEYVVKSLVSKPDAVKVDRRIDEKGVLLELTVDPKNWAGLLVNVEPPLNRSGHSSRPQALKMMPVIT